jgi:hypothetical protein
MWKLTPITEIAKYFGFDVTVSALDHRFRSSKRDAIALRAAYDAGGDPSDVACEGSHVKNGT